MARPRPTEVRRVAELLLSEAEDAEDLAARVIVALDSLRAERTTYAQVHVSPAGANGPELVWAYGPYSTRRQAQKGLDGVLEGSRAGVVPLYPPRPYGALQDVRGVCQGCDHPAVAHNWPKSKIAGCVIGLPVNGKPVRGAPPRCDCKELT